MDAELSKKIIDALCLTTTNLPEWLASIQGTKYWKISHLIELSHEWINQTDAFT